MADSQDMCDYLENLKKKQNKEELAKRRQAKRRTEVPERSTEAETPIKLKKVEVEIEGKETKHNENIGEYRELEIYCLIVGCWVISHFFVQIKEMDVSSESESETETETSSSETECDSTDEDGKDRRILIFLCLIVYGWHVCFDMNIIWFHTACIQRSMDDHFCCECLCLVESFFYKNDLLCLLKKCSKCKGKVLLQFKKIIVTLMIIITFIITFYTLHLSRHSI